MEKSIISLLQSKWIKRCFCLFSCVLILFCSVAPSVSADGITAGNSNQQTLMSGQVSFNVHPYFVNRGEVKSYHSFGGLVPYCPTQADSYHISSSSLYPLPDEYVRWWLESNLWAARYKKNLSALGRTIGFDSVRYWWQLREHYDGENPDEDQSASVTLQTGSRIVFDFDPYFMSSFQPDVFRNMVELRLGASYQVAVKITYSYFNSNTNYISTVTDQVVYSSVGNPNVALFYPLGEFLQRISSEIPTGGKLLIDDLVVTLITNGPYLSTSCQLALLAEQYSTGTPLFANGGTAAWNDYLDTVYHSSGGGNVIDFPTVDFVTFLADATSGFLDAELAPGFSLGGILSVCVLVCVMILLLKLFAGG